MIEVKDQISFLFNCTVPNMPPFNFQIFAGTETEAREKLIDALRHISDELVTYNSPALVGASKAN